MDLYGLKNTLKVKILPQLLHLRKFFVYNETIELNIYIYIYVLAKMKLL